MNMQQRIENKITEALAPIHLEVENETHMHNVPADSESHFKVTVASAAFEGLSLLNQHRKVNEVLANEIQSIHALALHTYTPDQWFERASKAPESPLCQGGSKA